MRADTALFRDVTSDSQLRGLQASLRIDRERANTLGVSIDAVRSALYSAFGERQVSTIYTSADRLPGHHGGGARGQARRVQGRHLHAQQHRRTGAAGGFATVDRTIGPTAVNRRRPAAGGDGVVQPRPGRAAGQRDQRDRPLPGHGRHAASIITAYGGDAAVFRLGGQPGVLIIARRCW